MMAVQSFWTNILIFLLVLVLLFMISLVKRTIWRHIFFGGRRKTELEKEGHK